MINLKRAYEAPTESDGYRVLVDRLWPRGMSKEKEHLDLWLREIAPSDKLREEFGHVPDKWEFFEKNYSKELDAKPALVQQLRDLIKEHKVITFVFGAKDEEHNNAVALKEYLEAHKK